MQIMWLKYASIMLYVSCLISCTPKMAAPENVVAAERNLALGLAYLENGNLLRAEDKLTRAVAQDPDSAMAQSALAYFYTQTGQMDKAALAYKKSIALAPHNGEMYNNYGVFLCQQGNYAEANAAFIKAAQQPNYLQQADAYHNASLCAAQAKEPFIENNT